MKIYKPKPIKLVRVRVERFKEGSKGFVLMETNKEEVLSFVKEALKDKVSPFPDGKRTYVHAREYIGGTPIKSKTVSFYGLTTNEVYKILIKAIKHHETTRNNTPKL